MFIFFLISKRIGGVEPRKANGETDLERVDERQRDGENTQVLFLDEWRVDFGQAVERRQELEDVGRDRDGGRNFRQVEQHAGQQFVHRVFHFQRRHRQRHHARLGRIWQPQNIHFESTSTIYSNSYR